MAVPAPRGPTGSRRSCVLEGGETVPLDAGVAARRALRRRERPRRPRRGARRARVGPRPAVVPPVPGLRRAGDDVRHAVSSLYDALTPVLGLGDLDELAASLAADAARLRRPAQGGRRPRGAARRPAGPRRRARRAGDGRDRRPQAGPRTAGSRAAGGRRRDYSEDPRSCAASPASRCRPTRRSATPSRTCGAPSARTPTRAATDAARATTLATLLRQALAVRDRRLTEDCPVCRTPDVLDDAWVKAAAEEAAQLEQQAHGAHAGRAPSSRPRAGAWSRCSTATRSPRPKAAQHLGLAEDVRARARRRSGHQGVGGLLRELTAKRRPRSSSARAPPGRSSPATCAGWLEQAQRGRGHGRHAEGGQGRREVAQGRHRRAAARALRADLRARDRELARAAAGVERRPARDHAQEGRAAAAARTSTCAPTASERQRARRDVPGRAARAVGLRLPAARRARRVPVPLRGDRRPGAGHGPVQGRRPRAGPAPRRPHAPDRRLHPRRPPARGDPTAAAGRDDAARRPPRAVDGRRPGQSRSPVQRYLDGARGYAKPDRLPPEVQARVVPMFCRSAVEAAAANIVRRRAAEHGTPSTRPTSRSTRRARCERRSRSCCSARPAARARSANEVEQPLRRADGGARGRAQPRRARRALDPSTLKRLPDTTREFIHELMA